MSEVAPMLKSGVGKEYEVRDEEGGGSRASYDVEQV